MRFNSLVFVTSYISFVANVQISGLRLASCESDLSIDVVATYSLFHFEGLLVWTAAAGDSRKEFGFIDAVEIKAYLLPELPHLFP